MQMKMIEGKSTGAKTAGGKGGVLNAVRKWDTIPKTAAGGVTIELACLIPVVLLVFVLTMYAVFYYHDKNILIGAAAETAVLGAQMERRPEEDEQTDLTDFFQERIREKLILFPGVQPEISCSETRVEVIASASRKGMKLQVIQRAAVVKPEEKIRRKRILESIISEEE